MYSGTEYTILIKRSERRKDVGSKGPLVSASDYSADTIHSSRALLQGREDRATELIQKVGQFGQTSVKGPGAETYKPKILVAGCFFLGPTKKLM